MVCLLVAAAACGPVDSGDAPAFVVVDPGALDFQAGDDSKTLLVQNTGGAATSVTIKVAAEADGVTWLEVDPTSAALDGGAAKALTVRVVNRTSLVPGTYDGSVAVEAPGLDMVSVPVTLAVGQPVLSLEPNDLLDFGDSKNSLPLVLKNTGAGRLLYAVKLPGPWLTTDAVLQKEILSNEPQTLELVIDRTLVPWYGADGAAVLVTSNGLEDGEHSSTAEVEVRVLVDASCEVDANCLREGYYCDKSGGTGECTLRKLLGSSCDAPGACVSGLCQQGVCCDNECAAACHSCANAGAEGSCTPVPDGTACEDEFYCTEQTECVAGDCGGGEPPDCSEQDSACSNGVCDEETQSCQRAVSTGHCFINDECHESGAVHAGLSCMRCLPEIAADEWTLFPGTCLIKDVCYDTGDAVSGECLICNPATPLDSSPAPDDEPCPDDGDPCTTDVCSAGTCVHPVTVDAPCDDGDSCTFNEVCLEDGACQGESYSCDDELDCTDNVCDGLGKCDFPLLPDACLIEQTCRTGGEALPDDPCRACMPGVSQYEWSSANELAGCDDGDFCTLDDLCIAGECVGADNDCASVTTQCRDAVCSKIDQKCVTFDQDDGLECDDGDACTVADACGGGLCNGADKDCSPLEEGNPCRHAWCDLDSLPEPGECVVEDREDGTECDDGNFCVVDEICASGICEGSAYQCPGKQCAKATCDDDLDDCTYTGDPGQVGDDCDDNDVCTVDTVCTAAGECGNGDPTTPEECKDELLDDNPCMLGICDPVDGCHLTAAEDGMECPLNNATAQCLGGQCVLVKCGDGWGDCNDKEDDGCEHNLTADHDNCGECDNICPDVADATVGCVDSQCAITKCDGHMGDCDGLLNTGCETDTWVALDHCGGCNAPCKKADFFANADVECSVGGCLFLGCHLGFEDTNGNCSGGKNCLDGCEACQPVGDGLTDIPDDGRDTDCDGQDTINDESRGYYVDGSYPFGLDCETPGLGSRVCPFKHPQNAVEALLAQDWSDPYAVMREVYIAQGIYYGVSPVVDATQPVQLAGGYVRTEEGPWERDHDRSLTTIEGDGGCAVSIKHDSALWGAVDGLTIRSKKLCFAGGIFARNLDMEGAGSSTTATLWLQESKSGPVSGHVGAKNWVVLANELTSLALLFGDTAGAYVAGNTFTGGLDVKGGGNTFINNIIDGDVLLKGGSQTYIGNTIGGKLDCVTPPGEIWWDNMTLTNNTIGAGIAGRPGEDWTVTGNTILLGGVVEGSKAGWTFTSNTVHGDIVGDFREWHMEGNVVHGGLPGIAGASTIIDNVIEGSVSVSGDNVAIERNVVLGDITTDAGYHAAPGCTCYFANDLVLQSNLIVGSVEAGYRTTVAHNTLHADSDHDFALKLQHKETLVAGNIFFWSGGTMETHYAVEETESYTDEIVLRNNLFIGFGEPGGALLYDVGLGAVTSVDALNTLADLPDCGKGGNLAYDSKLAGNFVSISPSAEGFMMPTSDSPFVDKGPTLPLSCGGFDLTQMTRDVTGQQIPCGDATEIGCYELCQ